jgi:hypothetical protein
MAASPLLLSYLPLSTELPGREKRPKRDRIKFVAMHKIASNIILSHNPV